MEGLGMSMESPWVGTSVFVTGHTGFKGSWLSLWLHSLGAHVHGYALNAPTSPNHFEVARTGECLSSDTRADILDFKTLQSALEIAQPQVVFHLAAQPLVRQGYVDPLGTFATNVMGTAHLLEAIRHLSSVKAVIVVTTDKVYENQEWVYPYREVDPLGGKDPYSASKAAAEIVTSSYRSSFFEATTGAQISTARAGNVIGGGDWSKDRLIPDCLQSFQKGKPVHLRYPKAIRPWQHVLEPLWGYILLAKKLCSSNPQPYVGAWNFGPIPGSEKRVWDVAQITASLWGDSAKVEADLSLNLLHEAEVLKLDISKTRCQLGWEPQWSVERALSATVDWHKACLNRADMHKYTKEQIFTYQHEICDLI